MNSKNVFLVGILLVMVFAVGFMVGRFSSVGNTIINDNPKTASESGDASTQEGTAVPSSSLTDDQKKMLSALGVDPESFVVTAEMVACAQASLGSVRVSEIQNGATPSLVEGAKLAVCYK